MIYFQGTDNKLWRANPDGSGGINLGGYQTKSTPVAFGNYVYQGTDNKLWQINLDGTGGINLGRYKTSSAPFAAAGSMYFQGTDDKLWKINLDGTGGVNVGGYKTGSTPFVAGGYVYFRGTDDNLWRVYLDGTGGINLGLYQTKSSPFVTQAYVYFQGTDDKLWRANLDSTGGVNLGGYKTSSTPFVTAQYVYFQGTDDKLWRMNLDGGGGTNLAGYKTKSSPTVDTSSNFIYLQGTDKCSLAAQLGWLGRPPRRASRVARPLLRRTAMRTTWSERTSGWRLYTLERAALGASTSRRHQPRTRCPPGPSSARSSSILALAAIATCVACGSATGEATGSTSEALCPVGVVCRHLPPPPPPPPPPPQGPSVTIAAADFEGKIQFALASGQLSIDTTGTATPIDGPPVVTITNPVWQQCVASESTCNSERGAVRLACIKLIEAECATIPDTIATDTAYYSYITFGPLALMDGASNDLFNVSTIHHVGTVSFDVDINRVGTTFGLENVSAVFAPGATANGPPGAWLSVSDIASATPTCLLSGDYPDVNLTDMTAFVSLSDITPTADGQSVDYGAEQSSFTFQWGVDDLPNWFVSEFVDVQETIQNDVTKRIDDAFTESGTHKAISAALGALIAHEINAVGVTSFTITQVIYVNGNWQVFYQPS